MKIDYLSISIKLILIVSILTSINNHLWHIVSTNSFLLILTFTPQILKKSTNLKFPKKLELFILFFVLLTLSFGKIKWVLAPLLFGLGTGLIALLILLIMYSSNKIKKNYFLILTYSFSFAITFATLLELAKYHLKNLLGQEISNGIYLLTMNNLTYVLIGSLTASLIGFLYMQTHFSFLTKIINILKKGNPELFKRKDTLKEIIEEIKNGEGLTQEFKSTLRTNLYTNKPDKKIEHGILKTICAFLNTNGGTLYIGVTDDGKILGIKKDNFSNSDKFYLHLTNIIKQKIGKTNLIDSEIIKIKDRHIARVKVKKSKKPNFLVNGKIEQFFVRSGPQTYEIHGSELINYVKQKFDNKK